jgi:Domain of unknown function DUF29
MVNRTLEKAEQSAEIEDRSPSLYEKDYVLWAETIAQQLRSQSYDQVDWNNLIEEIETLSRRERKALQSNLIVLLLHLLKWQFQAEMRSGSWGGSIVEHRQRIQDDLQDSPSLRSVLPEIWESAYQKAIARAVAETGLAVKTFPIECPYRLEEVLDDGFLPE